MVVHDDRKGLRVKKGKKGWAGWITKSEDDRQKFQDSVLRPSGSRGWVDDGQEGGLEVLQERVEEAAAAVMASTTATSNKNKFKNPDETRKMATEAAKCRNPVLRKVFRKKVWKARSFKSPLSSSYWSMAVPVKTGRVHGGGEGPHRTIRTRSRRCRRGFKNNDTEVTA